jgi:hypothetical protein
MFTKKRPLRTYGDNISRSNIFATKTYLIKFKIKNKKSLKFHRSPKRSWKDSNIRTMSNPA